jgi:formylglycine-generating enzyme required for sulfatase activity
VKRLLLLAAFTACDPAPLPPRGHLVVWIDTDATLSLIDSARIEVLHRDGRVVDSRETGVREGISFTVVGSADVRLTMWHAASGRSAPLPEESLQGLFALPDPPAEGTREVTLFLPLDRAGVAPEGAQPPEEGRRASRIGTSPLAARRSCDGAPREGEACVPGGAFWMGHPRIKNVGLGSADARRLVVLSPFFMDVHEVTVAAYRRDGRVYAGRFSGSYAGTDAKDHCAFTDQVGPHEDLPLNCVRREPAREYCQSRGGDLPTEAELEYAAGALGTSLYPWGDDAPSCEDLVWGRGGGSLVYELASQPGPCRVTTGSPRQRIGFPEPVTPFGRDVVVLPDGSKLHHLAGNLSEWTRDVFSPQEGACWQARAPNVFVDPVCERGHPGTPPAFSTRGGGFFLPARFVPRAFKNGAVEGAHLDVGFRCVRR